MRPLITHNHTAVILVVASVALWFVIEAVAKGRHRSETRTAPEWSYFFVTFVFLGCLAVATVAAKHNVTPLPGGAWWPVIAGVALIWIGSALRVWSIFALGRFFKVMITIQESHRVVDRGPYRWLRHPSYLGAILVVTGVGLAEGGWASTAIMLVGNVGAFVVRIRLEERILLQALGDEYSAYTRRTARLVPRVY